MSSAYTTAYKRIIVLTFGAGAAALLLYFIYLNATTSYELSAFTFATLAQVILATLGIDAYVLQDDPASGVVSPDRSEDGDR